MIRRSLFILGVGISVGVSLNINLQFNAMGEKQSSITLTNVEALANTEEPDKQCWLLGSLDCPQSPVKVLYIQYR